MRTVQSEITDDEKLKLLELENMKQNLEQQLQEMTKIIERQQEMITMAKRDPLTGLRNRQGIPELVNASLRAHCEGLFLLWIWIISSVSTTHMATWKGTACS